MGGPSVLRRFGYATLWTILGLLFFYITLVVMSLYSKGTTLELMTYNAWSRMASRATGAITTPFYAMALVVSPASLWSLFFVTWAICSHLVHLMILGTDTKVFAGPEYTDALKAQGNHPLLERIPTRVLLVCGVWAYACLFFLGLERVYGPGLGRRVRTLNPACRLAHATVWSTFLAFFLDRLCAAVMFRKSQEEVLYPIGFLAVLALAAATAVARHSGTAAAPAKAQSEADGEAAKKTN